jgi:hypothetical protein
VYAAAIKTLVTHDLQGNPGGTRPPILFVLAHTCDAVDTRPPSLTCTGPPLDRRLQADLAAALRSYAPVTFVAKMSDALDRDGATTKGSGIQVTLGPIRYADSGAAVPVALHRSLQSGEGTAVWLTRQGSQWLSVAKPPPGMVTGGWIS